MRWFWIDKFVEFTPRVSGTAVKCCSQAEEQVHDLYPDFPILPHSLIVEGMAQTAGLIVGEAREYREKVILAKVGKAVFHRLVRPGDTLLFHATVDQLNEQGASISGRVVLAKNQQTEARDIADEGDAHSLVAEIELMFSHIDQNMGGVKFPEHNFVFTDRFIDLLANFRADKPVKL
ncbi:MAG TPA: hypothetical protein VGB55_02700 [Tepidisphaeraceae bacterium]|jgi:3-hydroxyacyl-[acyl-carrier-protein] dehydratase